METPDPPNVTPRKGPPNRWQLDPMTCQGFLGRDESTIMSNNKNRASEFRTQNCLLGKKNKQKHKKRISGHERSRVYQVLRISFHCLTHETPNSNGSPRPVAQPHKDFFDLRYAWRHCGWPCGCGETLLEKGIGKLLYIYIYIYICYMYVCIYISINDATCLKYESVDSSSVVFRVGSSTCPIIKSLTIKNISCRYS